VRRGGGGGGGVGGGGGGERHVSHGTPPRETRHENSFSRRCQTSTTTHESCPQHAAIGLENNFSRRNELTTHCDEILENVQEFPLSVSVFFRAIERRCFRKKATCFLRERAIFPQTKIVRMHECHTTARTRHTSQQ